MSLAPTADHVQRDGFAVWRGLVDVATAERFEPVVRKVAHESPQHLVEMESRSTYQKAFVQEMNLWQRDDALRPLVFDERIARAAAALLGVDGVRLYHDQGLVKEPFAGATPWHCDQHYWPLDSDRTITAWIPLVDVPFERGPLRFCPGSHREDTDRELEISDRSEEVFRARLADGAMEIAEPEFGLGDVSFHLGWTWHGARANSTGDWRTVMTMIFAADGVNITSPSNGSQQIDRAVWLGDQQDGEPMGGPLHPLVWHRDGRHHDELSRLPSPERAIGTIKL